MVAAGIALVSGYANVVTFHRWNCFATMLTGNSLWLGRALLAGEDSVALHSPQFYLSIIVAFFFGAVFHAWADRRWRHRGASRTAIPMCWINLAVEICVFSVNKVQEPSHSGLNWLVVLYTPLFGVVSIASASGRLGSATMMVTAHVAKMAKALASLPVKDFTYIEKCNVLLSLTVLVAIIVGSFIATVVYAWRGYHTRGLFLPVFPLLAVLLWCHDHLARPRRIVKMYTESLRAKAQASEPREGGERQPQQADDPSEGAQGLPQPESPGRTEETSSSDEGTLPTTCDGEDEVEAKDAGQGSAPSVHGASALASNV